MGCSIHWYRIVNLFVAVFAIASSSLEAAQSTRVIRNIPYVPEGTADQMLDLYLPRAIGFATVIFVHGGSLDRGDDRKTDMYLHVCDAFVAHEMGCATIDYRVAPANQWPAMPEDVASAIRWVHDSVPQHGGDPARIFLFGHSSGCHLTASIGSNPRYLKAVGLKQDVLSGIIPMGCTLTPLEPTIRRLRELGWEMDSLRSRWNANPDQHYISFDEFLDSDPSGFVGPHVPPTLIVLAEKERFLPPVLEQAARFVNLLYEADRPADLVIVPGTHRSSIADLGKPGDPTLAAILRFIDDPLAAGAGSRPTGGQGGDSEEPGGPSGTGSNPTDSGVRNRPGWV